MGSSWTVRSLGTLGEFRNGVNFSRSQEGHGLPVLKVKDFADLVICPLNGLDELDNTSINIPPNQLLRDDDIVIVRSNGNSTLVGRSVLVRGVTRPITFTGFCIRFRLTDRFTDAGFLAYALRSPHIRDRLSRFGSGTGIQNLNQTILAELQIELPPLGEQRAIAGLLRALDDKIEQNRRTARVLEQLAGAIFKAWFIDFEPVAAKAAGAISFPSMPQSVFAALTTEFVDSEIGSVPQGWEVRTMGEVCDVNPPRSIRPGTLAPYLDMKNMPTQGHAPIAWVEREFGSGMRFMNGDTLVARITPCLENGKTAFVDFLDNGQVGWGSTEYIVLRPKSPLPPVFAYSLARTDAFRDHAIRSMSGTSGRQRVAASAMDHFKIAMPTADAAVAFGDLTQPIFQYIAVAINESRTLSKMRDLLLPKVLTGDMRVAVDAEQMEPSS